MVPNAWEKTVENLDLENSKFIRENTEVFVLR